MKEKNRFDLEQEILGCWRVVEDIKTITEMYDSGQSEDEVLNALIGIRALYEQKFSTLFDTFEACLVKKQFRE